MRVEGSCIVSDEHVHTCQSRYTLECNGIREPPAVLRFRPAVLHESNDLLAHRRILIAWTVDALHVVRIVEVHDARYTSSLDESGCGRPVQDGEEGPDEEVLVVFRQGIRPVIPTDPDVLFVDVARKVIAGRLRLSHVVPSPAEPLQKIACYVAILVSEQTKECGFVELLYVRRTNEGGQVTLPEYVNHITVTVQRL